MIYVDTSALVLAFIRKPKSEAAEGILCLDDAMAASAKAMGLNVLSV